MELRLTAATTNAALAGSSRLLGILVCSRCSKALAEQILAVPVDCQPARHSGSWHPQRAELLSHSSFAVLIESRNGRVDAFALQ